MGRVVTNSHRRCRNAATAPPSLREARGFAVFPCFVVKQVRRKIASAAEGCKGEGRFGCLLLLPSGEREAVFRIFLPQGGVSMAEKFLRAASAVHAAIEGGSPLNPPLKRLRRVKGGGLRSTPTAVAGLVLAAPLYFPPAGCGGMRFSRPIIGYFPRGGGGGVGMRFSRPVTVWFRGAAGAGLGGFSLV